MADPDDDPVYLDSRREALVILLAWLACMIWTVSYCYVNGYTRHDRVAGEVSALVPDLGRFDRTPDSLGTPFGLGIPDWALWGIVVPWVACVGFSAWLCFAYMKDDPEPMDRGEDEHMVDPARGA
ncbi:hypothetical protein [Tautonia plasticadhaerens]|uniref:Uncharacterized protein n=1 Tax=Tautonia plasticadhaerens TaxID=2527974 RepID=A0A518HBA6_9BACT|nr:hypothetical protein [Tautonia plasticadhaerens]QDV38144.1 hypothetical protein ElP_60930 [Tautonia plasticadhaerens]